MGMEMREPAPERRRDPGDRRGEHPRVPEGPAFEFERVMPGVERAQELARVRAVAARILATVPAADAGRPPTKDGRINQLERILAEAPQRDRSGNLLWLLTSGLAVELITGYERDHHDIDLVIMDPDRKGHYRRMYGTDNVTPGEYWADMSFDPEFLDTTTRRVRTRRGKKSPEVEVVHPGIIMVQKLSDAWGRPPRRRDVADVDAIVRHWKTKEGYTRQWNLVVKKSIDALPAEQQERTLGRLRRAIAVN